jgi:hypothetical protein
MSASCYPGEAARVAVNNLALAEPPTGWLNIGLTCGSKLTNKPSRGNTTIGTSGWSAVVGRKGGSAEVGAGLTYWVGAGVRANAYVVRPSGTWWAGVDRFINEAWNTDTPAIACAHQDLHYSSFPDLHHSSPTLSDHFPHQAIFSVMFRHCIPSETLGGAARSLFRVVRGPFDLYTMSSDGPLHSTLVISNPLFTLLGNSIWLRISLGTHRPYRSTSLCCLYLTVLPWTLYHHFILSPSYLSIVLQYKYSDVCSRATRNRITFLSSLSCSSIVSSEFPPSSPASSNVLRPFYWLSRNYQHYCP